MFCWFWVRLRQKLQAFWLVCFRLFDDIFLSQPACFSTNYSILRWEILEFEFPQISILGLRRKIWSDLSHNSWDIKIFHFFHLGTKFSLIASAHYVFPRMRLFWERNYIVYWIQFFMSTIHLIFKRFNEDSYTYLLHFCIHNHWRFP